MAVKSSVKKSAGFTLIEIIVALAIFALLTVLCFRGLTFILDYVERDEAYYQDQDRIQRAWSIILQDILHMRPRAERDRLGGVERAYQTGIDEYLLVLTRGGMPTITGTESGLQRVAYSLSEEGEFLRWTWPGMDLFSDEEPTSQLLIGDVNAIEFWQLNASNEFEQSWPPLNEQIAVTSLPRMIRLVIELQDGVRIERLIPGIEAPAAAVAGGGGGMGGAAAGGMGGQGGGANANDNDSDQADGQPQDDLEESEQ